MTKTELATELLYILDDIGGCFTELPHRVTNPAQTIMFQLEARYPRQTRHYTKQETIAWAVKQMKDEEFQHVFKTAEECEVTWDKERIHIPNDRMVETMARDRIRNGISDSTLSKFTKEEQSHD